MTTPLDLTNYRQNRLRSAINKCLEYPRASMDAPDDLKAEVIRWHDPAVFEETNTDRNANGYGLYAAILNADLSKRLANMRDGRAK